MFNCCALTLAASLHCDDERARRDTAVQKRRDGRGRRSPRQPRARSARRHQRHAHRRRRAAADGSRRRLEPQRRQPAQRRHADDAASRACRMARSAHQQRRVSRRRPIRPARSAASATSRSARSCGCGPIPAACRCSRFCRPINLPAASESKGLGSGQADFTIAVLTGTDFLTRGHIDVNYGIGRIGAGTGLPRFTQHLVSWSASAEMPGTGDAVSRRLLVLASGSRRRPRRRAGYRRDLRDQPAARPRRRRAGRPDRCRAAAVRVRRPVGRDRQRPGRPRRARAPARDGQARRRARRRGRRDDARLAPASAPIAVAPGRRCCTAPAAARHPRRRQRRPRRRRCDPAATSRCRPGLPRRSIARRAISSSAWSPATSISDGDLDVVASLGSLDLVVWRNDGAGHFTRLASSPTSDAPDPAARAVRRRRFDRVERMDPERPAARRLDLAARARLDASGDPVTPLTSGVAIGRYRPSRSSLPRSPVPALPERMPGPDATRPTYGQADVGRVLVCDPPREGRSMFRARVLTAALCVLPRCAAGRAAQTPAR